MSSVPMTVWIMGFAGAMGALGIVCILSRKTVLGVLIGVQILALGATLMMVFAGGSVRQPVEGHAFAFMAILSGVVQLIGGYALSVRLFYLKNKNSLDEIRTLKR